MATSLPTVIESVLVPLQAARPATTPASVQAMLRVLRVRIMYASVRSLAGVRFLAQPGRVVHASVAVDDHRVDSSQRFDEPDALLGSLDEHALGHAFGSGRVGPDDGDAAHAARRGTGLRIEDVVIA